MTIRILLLDPGVGLRSVIGAALAGQQDLMLTGEVHGEIEALLQAAETDVVVLDVADEDLPPVAERLVDENPRIGLLAMDLDRARGWVYQLRPQLTQIDSVTTAELADAIRCAANPTC